MCSITGLHNPVWFQEFTFRAIHSVFPFVNVFFTIYLCFSVFTSTSILPCRDIPHIPSLVFDHLKVVLGVGLLLMYITLAGKKLDTGTGRNEKQEKTVPMCLDISATILDI